MKMNPASLRAMFGKAESKLATAERQLAAGFADEASHPAFYAVFHAISAVLATKELSFSSHRETICAFNREFARTGIFPPDTTHQLRRLFDHRQTADYDWASVVDEPTAEEDVAAARSILAACREYVEGQIQDPK